MREFGLLNNLDKKDTTILKGLAIASIVFHNFFHVVLPVHENEFTFHPARFPEFLQSFLHPATTIQALFAFYGHLGVQVFIFLSAYGLAKSHWNDGSGWTAFMWSRIKKLYPIFGLAVLFWASLVAIHFGPEWVIKVPGLEILLMFAGVSTLVPGMGLPPVGPWWFIPFIMQFYAMWFLLRKFTNKFGWPGLVVLSVLCLFVTEALNPSLEHWMVNLTLTPIGRMRVICFGIIAARYPVRIKAWLAIPAFAILVIGNQYHAFFHLVSLASVVIALWLYMKMRGFLRESPTLEKLGEYSVAIFLLNGIVRTPLATFAHSPLSQFLLAGVSAILTFALSAWFHHLLTRAPKAYETESVPCEPLSEAADRLGLDPR